MSVGDDRRVDSNERAVAVFDAIGQGARAVTAIAAGTPPPMAEVQRMAGMLGWVVSQLKAERDTAESVERLRRALEAWPGEPIPDEVANIAQRIGRSSV